MPVYIRAEWAGGRAVGIACLVLSLAAVTCWSFPFAADLVGPDATPCLIAGGVLWLAQACALAWIGLRSRVGAGRRTLMLSLALFLLAPVVAFLTANPIAEALIFLLAYFLNVRVVARGWPLLFALLVIAGVLLFAGLVLEDVEDGAPDASILTFADAFVWGLGQVFRFQSQLTVSPVTPAGQVVGAIVIALSVVFAATLLSAIAAWAVGERQKRRADDEQEKLRRTVEQAVRSALADALGTPVQAVAPSPRERQAWLDLDRIVGSSVRSLWVERPQAIRELVHRIDEMAGGDSQVSILGAGVAAPWVGVVHDDDVVDDASTRSSRSLRVLPVAGSASDYIREFAQSGDVVVGFSRAIEAELTARGVVLVEPRALASALAAPASVVGRATA